MKQGPMFELVLRFYAAELVTAAYLGILGRAPDEEGLKAHGAELTRSRTLPAMLTAIAGSAEAWQRNLARHSADLARSLALGLLNSESDDAIATCAAELEQGKPLSEVLSTVVRSRQCWEGQLEYRSDELVQGLLSGLLGTAPAAGTLKTYSARLKATKNLADVAAAIAGSDAHWERLLQRREQLAHNAGELVQTVYRALLRREPEAPALQAYSSQLRETKRLADLLHVIGRSQEHWETLLGDKAEELVRVAFAALLNREPEEAALKAYAAQLKESKRLGELFSAISRSQEHWQHLLVQRAEELVAAVYRGLLSREPDKVGLAGHVAVFKTTGNLTDVVAAIGKSQERERKLRTDQELPHPALSYDHRTWVFLHVEKTAGTSLQNMLVDSFGARNVYREHADVLYLHCPAELSQYSVFAGHFNHDSLAFIPRRTLNIFTFVREPRERLISLYTFWRAHLPEAPGFHEMMRLANDLDIESFYRCDKLTSRCDTWNHMTWCIMGDRQWREWRLLLCDKTGDDRAELVRQLGRVIRKRVREFCFVGLQEDFARSYRLLFGILERPCPEERADHSVANLAAMHSHFRRLAKPEVTSATTQAIETLAELDTILYEEAKILYAERLSAWSHPVEAKRAPAARARPRRRALS